MRLLAAKEKQTKTTPNRAHKNYGEVKNELRVKRRGSIEWEGKGWEEVVAMMNDREVLF